LEPFIVSVDFDGTIAKNDWPNIDKLRFLAKYVLNKLREWNCILILNTCREGLYLEQARKFLVTNGIFFDYYNENSDRKIQEYGDCRKIGADLYIDDKNFGYWNWLFVLIYMFFKIKVRGLFVGR